MTLTGKRLSSVAAARAAAFAIALAIALSPIASPIALATETGTTRAIPLLMIVVEFDGGDNPESAAYYDNDYDWAQAIFGPEESPAAYYRDMSNGAFAFVPAKETSATGEGRNSNGADRVDDGIVHVTLAQPYGTWGAVNFDGTVTRDFARTVAEALRQADPYVDFASYDANGDGAITSKELAVCVCVAGYEASSVTDYTRNDMPLLWSHSGTLGTIDDDERRVDGARVDGYIAIAERYWAEGTPLESAEMEPLGVLYHELGHAIGLPDLYAVNTAEGPWSAYATGALSLMDSGGWQYANDGNGLRNIPTGLDAWSRYALGWTNPTIVAKSGDYTVSSQLSNSGYSTLIIPTNDPDQYFIVENRQAEGWDTGLSYTYAGSGGLVIWHVDQEMFHRYYYMNEMNDADHRPSVMESFYEVADGSYSTEWSQTSPIDSEAFFDAHSWSERLGDTLTLELPLYNASHDTPEAREDSGITLQFTSASARDMTVHVEIENEGAAVRNVLHLLDDESRKRLCLIKEKRFDRAINVLVNTLESLSGKGSAS